MALRTKQRRGSCPLCGEHVLFCRDTKGYLEAYSPKPTDEGYVLIQEGFSHVFASRDSAIAHLGFREGWIAKGFKPQEMLHEPHHCELRDLYGP